MYPHPAPVVLIPVPVPVSFLFITVIRPAEQPDSFSSATSWIGLFNLVKT